jgi:hypothetical protein
MAIEGKVYYREKTDYPPLFKQLLKVIDSDTGTHLGTKTIAVKNYSIDFSGLKIKTTHKFGSFPDEGAEKEDEFVKPIEEIDGKKLRDFIYAIFENKKYTGK